MTTAASIIASEVASWPEVSVGDTGRQGLAFNVGKIELGHIHGSAVAHLPFPRAIRDDLLARGEVTPHPVMPNSGWVAREIRTTSDIDAVIALFRRNHERAVARIAGQRTAALLADSVGRDLPVEPVDLA